MKVLMILTSNDKFGDTGNKTGYWLEEFAAPYYIFLDNKVEIDIASPKGGEPPIDPNSLADEALTPDTKRLLQDIDAQNKLKNSRLLSQVDINDYNAVFFPGGHGPLWDLVTDQYSLSIISMCLSNNKPVAAVCHGPAVFINAKLDNGDSVLTNKTVTSFTNSEESAVGLSNAVPFSLEDELANKGANFTSGADWGEFAVEDGLLITGQNPASSKLTAINLLNALKD